MSTVTEIERAIVALKPCQLHPLRWRLAQSDAELPDLVAHRAALLEGDFQPWTEVKQQLHALHRPRRSTRAKVS